MLTCFAIITGIIGLGTLAMGLVMPHNFVTIVGVGILIFGMLLSLWGKRRAEAKRHKELVEATRKQ